MTIKDISPDQVIFWQWGPVAINATIAFTWLVIILMVIGSWLITRRLSADVRLSRWQNLLEVLVDGIRNEIREISQQ